VGLPYHLTVKIRPKLNAIQIPPPPTIADAGAHVAVTQRQRDPQRVLEPGLAKPAWQLDPKRSPSTPGHQLLSTGAAKLASADIAATLKQEPAAAHLQFGLAFRNYDAEVAAMSGKYAPPRAELRLAHEAKGTPIACVGLRPIQPEDCCEAKRLFVTPAGRGTGVVKALVGRSVDVARRLGCREMRLDTLASITQAIFLYRKFGFVPMEANCYNPIENSQYMVLCL
jgi:GNAT superfamily N-acetyltransferase